MIFFYFPCSATALFFNLCPAPPAAERHVSKPCTDLFKVNTFKQTFVITSLLWFNLVAKRLNVSYICMYSIRKWNLVYSYECHAPYSLHSRCGISSNECSLLAAFFLTHGITCIVRNDYIIYTVIICWMIVQGKAITPKETVTYVYCICNIYCWVTHTAQCL